MIVQYADMHYALEEWKALHDRLQMVERSLERIELEVNRPGGNVNTEIVTLLWRSFALTQLAALQSLAASIRHIGTKLDLTSPIQPTRRIEWPEEFRSRGARVENELTRSGGVDVAELGESVNDFVFFTRDALVGADRALRDLAGDLASASKELAGAMKGL